MFRKSTLFALFIAGVFFTSCHKFEGQRIPAYIHIDSISLECDYYTYGAATCRFTDAWVSIDDQIIGCYELPATFPILEKGRHKVSIYGGIQIDGIGATRSTYVFCEPKVYANLNLVEDSIINLNPVLNYCPIGSGINFGWSEDFESTNTLASLSSSDTSAIRVGGNEAWHSENSFYSAKITLPPDSLDFWVACTEEMTFHNNYLNSCMMEMDYKCNDTFFVGVMYYKDYTLYRQPLVKVLPTDKEHATPEVWKKMYVNIGKFMNSQVNSSYFKVYFTSDLTTKYDPPYHPINEQRYYYFDNLKVIYR